ncbi:MAG: hypothetical protein JWO19_5271 [Bryobacterales bacterium]|nr:hypothetical protein [Bryobacterales bacterium]
MNPGGSKVKLGWIAILAIALLMTSLQAKLGLYHPEQSQAQLVSKSFKPSECRLERAVPDPPVAIVDVVMAAVARDDWRPDPDFQEYAPTQPRQLLLSRSHWFRPPPARS